MRFASWNVNSIKSRGAHVQKWLEETKTDVLMLQELKCVNEDFPQELFEPLGYHALIHGQKTYNGVAILSRTPLRQISTEILEGDEMARALLAEHDDFFVLNLYVPNGQEVGSDKFAYKMNFYDALYQKLKDLLKEEKPIIMGGDFNVALSDLDCYAPDKNYGKLLYSPEELRALRRIVNLGFADSFRVRHPNESRFSWWDYRGGSYPKNQGFRIDYLFLSPQATDRLEDASIDETPRGWDTPSDHTPVCATLKF